MQFEAVVMETCGTADVAGNVITVSDLECELLVTNALTLRQSVLSFLSPLNHQ